MNIHAMSHANGFRRVNGSAISLHDADALPIRPPPHNLQLEQAIIGAFLVNNAAHERVSSFLDAGHFFDPLHREIVEVIGRERAARRLVTPVTLIPHFENHAPIEPGLTVPQYLGRLAANATTIINAYDYGRNIVDLATRRAIISYGEILAEDARNLAEPVAAVVRHHAAEMSLLQSNDDGRLKPMDLAELLAADLQPREWIIDGLMAECSVNMLYAWRGGCKTWAALAFGLAAASGGEFLKWKASHPCNVLHVCGEMPAVALKERLEILGADAPPGNYSILSADRHEQGLPDLATPEGQAAADAVIRRVDAKLIILDNLSTLMRSGIENESEGWLPVQNWLLALRRQGRSVLVIHHANKARGQRGTSRREDILDVVLNFREPQDYDPAQGARFEVHFEKARGLHGDAVEPFEAQLEIRGGRAVWTMRELADAHLADIEELRGQGRSIRQIAKELGISKSAVQRALAKSACPAVPRPRAGTAGQQGAARDTSRDTPGTDGQEAEENQYREVRDGGT